MDIEQRLAALENGQTALSKSLWRWRLASIGLALGLLAIIGVAADAPKDIDAGTLHADKIIVGNVGDGIEISHGNGESEIKLTGGASPQYPSFAQVDIRVFHDAANGPTAKIDGIANARGKTEGEADFSADLGGGLLNTSDANASTFHSQER